MLRLRDLELQRLSLDLCPSRWPLLLQGLHPHAPVCAGEELQKVLDVDAAAAVYVDLVEELLATLRLLVLVISKDGQGGLIQLLHHQSLLPRRICSEPIQQVLGAGDAEVQPTCADLHLLGDGVVLVDLPEVVADALLEVQDDALYRLHRSFDRPAGILDDLAGTLGDGKHLRHAKILDHAAQGVHLSLHLGHAGIGGLDLIRNEPNVAEQLLPEVAQLLLPL
mmetsp:Transcript_104880/g.303557  ORF Transcript_104880/g.303557 Transcript_104880/m.303557 type:complete len:223 (-) Transcript_104880:1648-2316(-)